LLSAASGFLTIMAIWATFFWPSSLGGPASYVVVQGTSMQPGLHTGDLVITRRASSYHVGEAVAFKVDGGQVIHRLYSGSPQSGFTTKGDNRQQPDPWRIRSSAIIGQELIKIPHAGTALVGFRQPIPLVLGLAGLAVLSARTSTRSKVSPARGQSEPDAVAI
jgi:signal peptidase